MTELLYKEEGQLINYLKATEMKLGVLINFGHFPSLEWKRLVFTRELLSHPKTPTLQEVSPDYQTPISDD
jgi:PD-(D/E)XK nuclease superfamily protein